MALDLSVVLVNYNTRQLLVACLESIYASAERDNLTESIECIVIDNGSSDGSPEAVRKAFPQARLIQNKVNRYFSAAYTQGIELGNGRYVLALNPDTVIQGHTLAQLIRQVDADSQIGAATTVMYFPNGQLQRNGARFVSFSYLVYNYTFIGKLFAGRLRSWNDDLWYTDWDRTTPRKIDVLPGSCIIAKKETWRAVGGFDARMLMYFSDDYVSRSVQKLGLQTAYLLSDGIIHYEGQSTKQVSAWALRTYMRDLLVYTRLVFGVPAQWLLAILVAPTFIVQQLRSR